jgi:putative redox protein
MQMRSLSILNREGHALAARLDMPSGGSPVAVALYAHCFTCTKNIKAAANLSRALVARRLAVCRFDFTGLGQSAGAFADTTFSSNVTDLLDVADYLSQAYEAPRLLIGHSLGGAAAIQAAAGLPGVRAIVTIGAPADPQHVLSHFSEALPRLEAQGEAQVTLEGRTFRFRSSFIDNLASFDQAAAIRNLKRPLLVMHAPTDDTVGIENAGQIFQTARHPKSFISLDGADHLLSQSDQARYAGDLIAAWASKYVQNTAAD